MQTEPITAEEIQTKREAFDKAKRELDSALLKLKRDFRNDVINKYYIMGLDYDDMANIISSLRFKRRDEINEN